jgi:hypothetical protein
VESVQSDVLVCGSAFPWNAAMEEKMAVTMVGEERSKLAL